MNHDKPMRRRHVLQLLSVTGGLAVLSGCNKGGGGGTQAGSAAAPKAQSCSEKGEIDDAAANLRKVLQYKDKTDNPAKKCVDCAQYEPAKYGDCGGCKLFAGGVNNDGVCLSFAPKAAPGAAPAAAPGAAPAAPAAPAAQPG